MVAIRYYRQYLWIFFYMFFILMAVALFMDFFTEDINTSPVKLPRFLNVLICFFFSGLAILMQYSCSRRILGLRFLSNRKKWFKKRIRVTKKSKRRAAKILHLINFYLVNSISNILVLAPIFAVSWLMVLGKWENVKTNGFHLWFFVVAIFIKYFAWYLTLLTSRFSIFLNKRRINRLV